jgi:hypothetical protein
MKVMDIQWFQVDATICSFTSAYRAAGFGILRAIFVNSTFYVVETSKVMCLSRKKIPKQCNLVYVQLNDLGLLI